MNTDFITAYRTAPHTDVDETVHRALALLIDAVEHHTVLAKAFVRVPLLLAGEKTSTDWEPGAGLYQDIQPTIDRCGIVDASVLVGYAWADEPRTAAAVLAYGTVRERTQAAAVSLAGAFWHRRREFRFGTVAGSVDECIEGALCHTSGFSIISDSGDNPTAGGTGDVPYVLGRMIALGVRDAVYASIADPVAVHQCFVAGSGGQVSLSLGGKLDNINGSPLAVRGTVESLFDLCGDNRKAVVDVSGILVIVTDRRTPFHHVADFVRLGIDLSSCRTLAVKLGYLVPELSAIATKCFLALSPGAVNQDINALRFSRIRRPLFPLDQDIDFFPEQEALLLG